MKGLMVVTCGLGIRFVIYNGAREMHLTRGIRRGFGVESVVARRGIRIYLARRTKNEAAV